LRKISLPRLSPWECNLWAIVWAELFLFIAFQGAFVFMPYYVQTMGLTDPQKVGTWTGTYQAIGAFAFAIFTPIWGMLGDRYGRRLMLVRAVGATVIVMSLTSFARTPSELLRIRVFQGCATGSPSAASALIAGSAPKERLAFGLGLLQTFIFIGSFLGPIIGGILVDSLGYRTTFRLAAILSSIALLIVLTLVRDPKERKTTRSSPENPLKSLRALLSYPAILLIIGIALSVNTAFSLLGPILPLFIQEIVADPDKLGTTAGTINGIAFLAGAVSSLVAGRLSDRFGCRRTLIFCFLGMGLTCIPQSFIHTATWLGILQSIQGFFRGGIGPSLGALIVKLASKEKAGAALGLMNSAYSIGFSLGPILGAIFLTHFPLRAAFSLVGGILLLIAFALTFIGKTLSPGLTKSNQLPPA